MVRKKSVPVVWREICTRCTRIWCCRVILACTPRCVCKIPIPVCSKCNRNSIACSKHTRTLVVRIMHPVPRLLRTLLSIIRLANNTRRASGSVPQAGPTRNAQIGVSSARNPKDKTLYQNAQKPKMTRSTSTPPGFKTMVSTNARRDGRTRNVLIVMVQSFRGYSVNDFDQRRRRPCALKPLQILCMST